MSPRFLAAVLVFPFPLRTLLFPALTFSSVFYQGSRIVQARGKPRARRGNRPGAGSQHPQDVQIAGAELGLKPGSLNFEPLAAREVA